MRSCSMERGDRVPRKMDALETVQSAGNFGSHQLLIQIFNSNECRVQPIKMCSRSVPHFENVSQLLE